MADVAAGDLSARARVRGLSEVSFTARMFNRMADELEERRGSIDRSRKFYEAYLPIGLLRSSTGKTFSVPLEAGSRSMTESVTLVMKLPAEAADDSPRAKALLEDLIRTTGEYGGSAVVFGSDVYKAVFINGEKETLQAALKMQRQVQAASGSIACAGLASGVTEIIVAGSEDQKDVLVKDSGEAESLADLAGSLREALIVTERIRDAVIADSEQFHFRTLGKIAIEEYVPGGQLYELLDAELPEVTRKRNMTRFDFEEGVRAYADGDRFTARRKMIRCLAYDPDDRADS